MPPKKSIASITRSSGNVFADLRLPAAREKLTRARLAFAINQILKDRRLSQTAAANLLRISQPKISALSNYQLDGFSVERLLRFLNALGHDVEIIIRRPRRRTPPSPSRKLTTRRTGKILVSAT